MTLSGPLLVIRADAGHSIGIGHVMRTLAVAQCWQARGGQVAYLSASLPDALRAVLANRSIAVHPIRGARDASETVAAMTRLKGSALLVDHYALPDGWWSALPAERRWRTAAINDFVEPLHEKADVLVSPRVRPLPGQTASGAGYLLVRNELRRTGPVHCVERARRVLVVLGGADPLKMAPAVADWLLSRCPEISVRVVDGPAAINGEQLAGLARKHLGLETVVSPDSMRPHYEWADTVICSPSTSAFEALHHGKPTGLVITADNQSEVARELLAEDATLLIADARSGEFAPDGNAWETLSFNPVKRRMLGERGAALVDGKGAERVCALLGLPDVHFRDATLADARLLLDWANDPVVRRASFSEATIPWEQHLAWMTARLQRADPFWLADDENGNPLAVVRFDPGADGTSTISYNLAPDRRGGGLSALILEKASRRFRENHSRAPVHAWIKPENTASLRCFEKAGFVQAQSSSPDRQLYVLSS